MDKMGHINEEKVINDLAVSINPVAALHSATHAQNSRW
jgi:hypothetical protein